jgi:gamma-glutamylcyclotransferase (GGCT)/AIG2-like uncharacterized protein YtfP
MQRRHDFGFAIRLPGQHGSRKAAAAATSRAAAGGRRADHQRTDAGPGALSSQGADIGRGPKLAANRKDGSMAHRVFVYGTLKRGGSNHSLLQSSSEFLGEAVTVPTYRMLATSFPVIMPDATGKPVAGEIYAVDDTTLVRLDQLEREGRSYDRVVIVATATLANAERSTTRAFIYVGRADRFAGLFASGPLYEQVNARGELDWRASGP